MGEWSVIGRCIGRILRRGDGGGQRETTPGGTGAYRASTSLFQTSKSKWRRLPAHVTHHEASGRRRWTGTRVESIASAMMCEMPAL